MALMYTNAWKYQLEMSKLINGNTRIIIIDESGHNKHHNCLLNTKPFIKSSISIPLQPRLRYGKFKWQITDRCKAVSKEYFVTISELHQQKAAAHDFNLNNTLHWAFGENKYTGKNK